jgi:hypothetical protein
MENPGGLRHPGIQTVGTPRLQTESLGSITGLQHRLGRGDTMAAVAPRATRMVVPKTMLEARRAWTLPSHRQVHRKVTAQGH